MAIIEGAEGAQMNPVRSCPAAMLDRIERAKQSIADDKIRAKEQGREYRPIFSPIGYTPDALAIFERLASDENMEGVWKALSHTFDDTKRRPDTLAFADFCYQSIGIWRFSAKRTPAEHRKHFEQLADDMMSVATRIIVEPDFGAIGQIAARVSPLDMVSDDFLESLLETMGANPIDGFYIKDEKDAVSYFRFNLHDVVPDFYHFAEWIAEWARRIATQSPISERPHRDTAQRIFFVKHLSKWFRDHFGKPMHEVVAGVASALFGEAVTADTVRKATQSTADISISFRRGKPPLPE